MHLDNILNRHHHRHHPVVTGSRRWSSFPIVLFGGVCRPLLLLGVAVVAYFFGFPAGTQAYTVYTTSSSVVIPETIQPPPPIFLNFSLLPLDAWTYTVRSVWRDGDHKTRPEFNSITSTPEKMDQFHLEDVVWWDADRYGLAVDPTRLWAISAAPLTVIIEARRKSLTVSVNNAAVSQLVCLIPVTVRPPQPPPPRVSLLGAEENIATTLTPPADYDYPHVIRSYGERPVTTLTMPPMAAAAAMTLIMNVTNALPHFARHCPQRSGDQELAVRDGGVFWRWGKWTGFQPVYHSLMVDCGSGGGAQVVDLIFTPLADFNGKSGGQSSNQWERGLVKPHRRRRHHRRVRATAPLYFAAPSYTAVVLEEFPPPVYVVHMNVSSSARAVRFSMMALMDSRSQAMFNMDAESGVVTTEVQLDREAISQVRTCYTAHNIYKKYTENSNLGTIK